MIVQLSIVRNPSLFLKTQHREIGYAVVDYFQNSLSKHSTKVQTFFITNYNTINIKFEIELK